MNANTTGASIRDLSFLNYRPLLLFLHIQLLETELVSCFSRHPVELIRTSNMDLKGKIPVARQACERQATSSENSSGKCRLSPPSDETTGARPAVG